MEPYAVVAHNSATASANKIHDDQVARRFGFEAGLVPGVDVYAYLTHPPAAVWGLDWLTRGRVRARFGHPVYDGRRVEVLPRTGGVLEVRDGDGVVCATGEADLPATAPEPPDPGDWPDVDQVVEPPAAAPETLVPGTAFGLAPHRFHAEHAGTYLDDVR